MALSEVDRQLLQRCVTDQPNAWEEFVDRFLGLVLHVVDHAGQSRHLEIPPQDREEIVAEVFLALIEDDFKVLKRFKQRSSLATYLTVIARRVAVREILARRLSEGPRVEWTESAQADESESDDETAFIDQDQIAALLDRLATPEAEVIRMFHLEGRSYEEISSATGMPTNSIGPTLTRARAKMKRLVGG